MKKLVFGIPIIILISMLVLPAGINVTSPNASSVWDVGKTYPITWNGSCAGANVKINIFKNSATQANFVTQLISNSGSTKNWNIPSNFAPGKYVIRVKNATDNNCFGDSAQFEIKGLAAVMTFETKVVGFKLPKQQQTIITLQYPNFHIYGMTSIADKTLVILYENLGSNYQGDLELKYQIKGTWTTVSRHVFSTHNTRDMFPTGRILTPADLEADGKAIIVRAEINPGRETKIVESDYTNNNLYKTLRPDFGIPDYQPNDITFEVTKRSSQDRHLPWGHLKVRVKNLNSSYNGQIKTTIKYRFEDESGHIHQLGPVETHNLNLAAGEQKWIKLQYMYWPLRDTTTKERVSFKVIITPGSGNPEIILSNNEYIRMFLHPDGPF